MKRAYKTPYFCLWQIHVMLTPLRWEVETATLKIVFLQLAFQPLYSAHAQVSAKKDGLPWLLYIWWLTFVCCQEMKRSNLHENHQLSNWPHLEPQNRNAEAWIEPHATEQWAFSPCKAKPAEQARPHMENEGFGRWPVRPSKAETLGVRFQKKIPSVNGLMRQRIEWQRNFF
jgi:hypothetical protein